MEAREPGAFPGTLSSRIAAVMGRGGGDWGDGEEAPAPAASPKTSIKASSSSNDEIGEEEASHQDDAAFPVTTTGRERGSQAARRRY